VKKYLILFILISVLRPLEAGKLRNSEKLIGTWHIYNSADEKLFSIQINLAISKNDLTSFIYKTISSSSADNEALYGYMLNKDQIVFEKIVTGELNTYLFDLDFNASGGPGLQVNTKLADCDLIENDNLVTSKKFAKRLTSNSLLCEKNSSQLSTVTELKMVKENITPSAIAITATVPSSITKNLDKVSSQLGSTWRLRSNRDIKFLLKDIQSNFLGYQFTYRLIDKKQILQNITEDSFKSQDRFAFVLDKYLIINTSDFPYKNGLTFIKLNKKRKFGRGELILTANSDCFSAKNNDKNIKVCTPNFDSTKVNSQSKKIRRALAKKVATKTQISF
jgi:hypothetical protein